MEKLNFEEYRQPWETGPHWELKREFLERYQDVFSEERLLCLAQAYSNIELLQCSYPTEVMLQIHELSKSLTGCKRFRRNENSSQQDNDKSPQAKKGKRSLEDVQSLKKFKFINFCSSDNTPKNTKDTKKRSLDNVQSLTKCKFIKFCSSDNTPKSTDGTSNVSHPIKIMNVDYSLITQSPEAKLIEKLASQVQKLLLIKKAKAMDAIQSAALLLNMKRLVHLKFTNQTTTNSDSASNKCICEFFIGTTRISTGDGNDNPSAQKKASEYALHTLMNFQNLPTKKLTDVKKECENLDLEEKQNCESDLVNLKEKNSLNICTENCSFTQYVNSDLLENESKSDVIFLQTFAKELKKNKKTNGAPLVAINEAGTLLNILGLIVFDISEDVNSPIHNRIFICNFTIKNILISRGEGPRKKTARSKAAAYGVKCLLNLLERNEKNVSNSKNILITKDILEEKTTLDKLQSDGSLNKKITNTILLDRTASGSQISKSANDVKSENCNKDSLNKKNICQKNSSNNTCNVNNLHADDEMNKLPPVIRNSCQEIGQTHSSTVNKTLLKNSFQRQLVLFDRTEIIDPLHNTPGSILTYSAQQCRKEFSYHIEKNSDNAVKVHATLDKKIVGTAVGLTKESTKKEAAKCALENLRKEVCTIKVKNEEEKGVIINRSQMLKLSSNETSVLSEDNIGCKMLKMMGWSGGGIGKKEGIIEPVSVQDNSQGRGLGYKKCDMDLKNFKQKVNALLSNYSSSNSTEALLFSPEFEKSERKEIHRIAMKYNLSNNSYGKNDARQLCIKRKIAVTELLNSILESGGCTDKYELVDIDA